MLFSFCIINQCYFFFSHQDSSRFDRKLNDENLTKCIQTLKHMYEDLRHHDIQCPNEPEFRTYDVLLNLNDGDTLQVNIGCLRRPQKISYYS